MTKSDYFCKFDHEKNLNLLKFTWVLEDLGLSDQVIAVYDNSVFYSVNFNTSIKSIE
jgi:hypothetical protein